MKKKIVFVGIGTKYEINPNIRTAMEELRDKNIPTSSKSIYYAGFDTPHVHVRFVCSGDDDNDLCGLRADAVFGSLWNIMIRRMNPGADNWRKLDIGLIDYICQVEREASESRRAQEIGEAIHAGFTLGMNHACERRVTDTWVGDMWPKTYITTAGISGNDELRKRWLNSIYGKGVFDGLRHLYVTLDEMPEHKDESLYNRAILMSARRNGKYPLSADVVRELFEHAEKAGVLKPTLRKIPEITQEDIDKMLQSPFDDRGFIQRQIYNALLKGENKMNEAVREYMRRDIAGAQALADAMRNVNRRKLPGIKNVHFSGPCTVVIWEDKTKTVVRCKDNDTVDYEKGLAMAIAKKALGTNKSGSNYYDIFKKWLPKEETEEVTE